MENPYGCDTIGTERRWEGAYPVFCWLRLVSSRNKAGFALLDVLLGIAIISIALVGIAFAWRQSTVTTVSARNYNQATYYAQQALEKLKVNDGKTSATLVVPWAATATVNSSGVMPAFTIATTLFQLGDSPEYDGLSSGIKDKLIPVKATVTWQESGGAGVSPRTLSIVCYYYLK